MFVFLTMLTLYPDKQDLQRPRRLLELLRCAGGEEKPSCVGVDLYFERFFLRTSILSAVRQVVRVRRLLKKEEVAKELHSIA